MKQIGWKRFGFEAWTHTATDNDAKPVCVTTADGDPDSNAWTLAGYILPGDVGHGGPIFPNKLTGGVNAVPAYFPKRINVVAPSPEQAKIVELQARLMIMKNEFRDKAALAIITGLVVTRPNEPMNRLATIVFDIAEALAAERERRNS